ncbi:MAG: PIG-L family deacetylase [Anaerolineales bacterium]|nr:PIG-L family deacetylase [Anaerolineales bacterium]
MTVLVIAAHPDDEALGCGGVIARHAAEGEAVHVLVVTRAGPPLFCEETVAETWQEMRKAHAILGVRKMHALNFPAPKLDTVPGHALADSIQHVIAEVRPETVYVHHSGDIHLDHQAVYKATLVAARPINACPVKRILCYETLSETEWASSVGDYAFVPNVFIDISATLEIKLEAMACYQSQLREQPHSRSLGTLRALAELRGNTVGVDAAEAFMLVREIR